MKVAIIGGNGFIGKYLVAKLHQDHDVSIFTRQAHLPACFEHITNLTAFCKQSYAVSELQELLQSHDVVINLIGILNEKGHSGQGFYKAHVESTQNIIQACKASQVPRYLHMSALHAHEEDGTSHYQRSKGMAEAIAHANHSEQFAVTSFRPSVIFGPGDSLCNRFASLLKWIPLAFPLACAQARFAPIYAGDVADTMIESIQNKTTYQQGINLCGPNILSLAEIVQETALALGKKRKIIALPSTLAYMQAAFMDYCVPGKPFSIDNFNSLKIDSICDAEPIGTHVFHETIDSYLHLPLEEQYKLILK